MLVMPGMVFTHATSLDETRSSAMVSATFSLGTVEKAVTNSELDGPAGLLGQTAEYEKKTVWKS